MNPIYDYYDDNDIERFDDEQYEAQEGRLRYNRAADCYEFWSGGSCVFPRINCGRRMQVLVNGSWQLTTLQKIGSIWYLAGTLYWGYLEDATICI